MPSLLLVLTLLAGAPEHYGRMPDSFCAPEAWVLDRKRPHKDPLWWDYARIFVHLCLGSRACVRFNMERAMRELLEREGSFQEAWRQVNERWSEHWW
jgi:hypothetical protein